MSETPFERRDRSTAGKSYGRGLDVVDGDGLDRAAIPRQLVVGEVVHGEPGERADDRPGRLESKREDADQEVLGELQLVGGDRLRADALKLGHRVDHRGDRDLRVHGRPGRERPASPPEVVAGAGTVRVALLLAELRVQP